MHRSPACRAKVSARWKLLAAVTARRLLDCGVHRGDEGGFACHTEGRWDAARLVAIRHPRAMRCENHRCASVDSAATTRAS